MLKTIYDSLSYFFLFLYFRYVITSKVVEHLYIPVYKFKKIFFIILEKKLQV